MVGPRAFAYPHVGDVRLGGFETAGRHRVFDKHEPTRKMPQAYGAYEDHGLERLVSKAPVRRNTGP